MNNCDDEVVDGNAVRPERSEDGGEDEMGIEIEDAMGERKTKKLQDPKLPSRSEIDEHNLTHLPFRSWCRHCVRGRGKEMPHRRGGEAGDMPELHADMCFWVKKMIRIIWSQCWWRENGVLE